MVAAAEAQHCPPIDESYLSQVSIQHGAGDQALELKAQYSKTGGQEKEKYQIYLLAYLEKNADRVPAPSPADLIDKQVVRIVHTQAIERNDRGTYGFQLRLPMTELAKSVIELGRLMEKDREDFGGWGRYKDRVRLAVFVPYLEDKTYSVSPSCLRTNTSVRREQEQESDRCCSSSCLTREHPFWDGARQATAGRRLRHSD